MTSPTTLLKAWNLRPKKKLGQNFLVHPATSEAIVQASEITSDDDAMEIGAGLGALTLPLAKAAKTVTAIEKDASLAGLLKTELLAHSISNVNILTKNILNLNIDEFVKGRSRKLIVLGNLPYNISSQVLIRLIASRNMISHAVVMFQKELAQRIMEPPGSKKYGRLSAMMQYCSDISKVMTVSADQFFPKPKIDSMVLRIDFKTRPDYPADDERFLFQVIKAAFGQRRKTLKNALQGSELHINARDAVKVLELSGIDPVRRAETLDVREFVTLSNLLKNKTG